MTPARPVERDAAANGGDRPVSTANRDRLVAAFDSDQFSRTPGDACSRQPCAAHQRYRRFDLEVDLVQRHVCRSGQGLAMTEREWILVDALVSRAGSVWPRSDLRVLLSRSGAACSSNALSILLFNLRSKLGKDVIQTIRGRGYRLTPSNEVHGDARPQSMPK
jgi:two-component system OmpR family response regulator